MSLSKHPNVLRVRGSWIDGHKIYIALRLMNKGSAADVMQYGWPGGMEEEVICCILRQALQGLKYVSPVVSMGRVRLLILRLAAIFISMDLSIAMLRPPICSLTTMALCCSATWASLLIWVRNHRAIQHRQKSLPRIQLLSTKHKHLVWSPFNQDWSLTSGSRSLELYVSA